MTLSWHSLSHALEIFQENKMSDKDSLKLEVTADALKVCSMDAPPSLLLSLLLFKSQICTTKYT